MDCGTKNYFAIDKAVMSVDEDIGRFGECSDE
jgi:hypothetical protein